MLKKLAFLFTMILILVSNHLIYSQDFSDISSLNLRELTDPQIDLLLRRAGAQGYNEFDILKIRSRKIELKLRRMIVFVKIQPLFNRF